MFCDHSHGLAARCVSMIRIGGNCSGYKHHEPVCYNGRCINGRCVPLNIQQAVHHPLILPKKEPKIMSVQADCYNENECCSTWASAGECERNPSYMNEWCKVACKICHPNFNPLLGWFACSLERILFSL
ncbi:unnamed protein product [Anisakis simplex]|uniref:ShKT domain-containing protein n=1 Tax=Anisakis simplex TaxID=6269 RepID=A0A3P6NUC4_ANISI|nr:unnamed protein product [Anisakis simplex]